MMEDSWNVAIGSNKFLQNRVRPKPIPIENFAVEPWGKNTVDLDSPESPGRKFKTFYQSPSVRKVDPKNATQKLFAVRKQYTPSPQFSKVRTARREWNPTQTPTKSKVAISSYNINGSLLVSDVESGSKRFNNQFYVKKHKSPHDRLRETSVSSFRETNSARLDCSHGSKAVSVLTKRLKSKQRSEVERSQGYVGLANEQIEQLAHLPKYPARRRSKILSVGFQKFACLKGLVKHRSASLGIHKQSD